MFAIRQLRAVVTAAAVMCVALSSAQDGQQDVPLFRSTTRLIQVNVVVQDKHGRAITDLRKDECEILDNGQRQHLALFVLEDAARTGNPMAARGIFTNQLPLATGARSGYSVVLLDWLNTSWADQAYARQQTIRMLEAIGQRDRVALYVLGRGLRVVHEFTQDIEALRRKVTAERGLIGSEDLSPPSMVDASVGQSWLSSGISPESFSRQDQFFTTRRILDTLKTFEAIAAHLAAVPGRKSLIWVSGGFPTMLQVGSPAPLPDRGTGTEQRVARAPADQRIFNQEIDRALSRLNDADVAVYPIDARGLLVSSNAWINIATMQELAGRTGGKAYFNRNDLDVAMRSALDDVAISYTLGYYAPPGESNRDVTHRLRVIVHRPGVVVRHRREYLQAAANRKPAEVESDRRQAWVSPVDATALSIGARAVRSGDKLAIDVLLDPGALSLVQKDGRRAGKVDILAGFRKPDGASAGAPISNTLTLSLREQTYEAAAKDGLKVRLALAIPKDASVIRLLVRDTGSNKLGTLTISLLAIAAE